MSESVNAKLARGEMVVVGNGLYQKCQACEQVVRLNKPLIGSFHLCLTEEEIAAKRAWQSHQPPYRKQ